MLSKLSSDKKIEAVMVEGIKVPFYYHAEDENLMQEILAGTADLKPRMSFIAPLDPLLWDKALILALWDFRYSWEIYTPVSKRKYGYYTLPIVYGDRFVGRIEAVPDRKAGILQVNGLWWEPGIRQTKALHSALERALSRFAKFNNCKTVKEQRDKNEKKGNADHKKGIDSCSWTFGTFYWRSIIAQIRPGCFSFHKPILFVE